MDNILLLWVTGMSYETSDVISHIACTLWHKAPWQRAASRWVMLSDNNSQIRNRSQKLFWHWGVQKCICENDSVLHISNVIQFFITTDIICETIWMNWEIYINYSAIASFAWYTQAGKTWWSMFSCSIIYVRNIIFNGRKLICHFI